jgi:hypothetical protein
MAEPASRRINAAGRSDPHDFESDYERSPWHRPSRRISPDQAQGSSRGGGDAGSSTRVDHVGERGGDQASGAGCGRSARTGGGVTFQAIHDQPQRRPWHSSAKTPSTSLEPWSGTTAVESSAGAADSSATSSAGWAAASNASSAASRCVPCEQHAARDATVGASRSAAAMTDSGGVTPWVCDQATFSRALKQQHCFQH